MSERFDDVKQLVDECTPEEPTALLDYFKARLPQHALEKEWVSVPKYAMMSRVASRAELHCRCLAGRLLVTAAIVACHCVELLIELEGHAKCKLYLTRSTSSDRSSILRRQYRAKNAGP